MLPYRKIYYAGLLASFVFLANGCSSKKEDNSMAVAEEIVSPVTYTYPEAMPQTLQECIESYGGVQAWKEAGTLTYDLVKPNKRENHVIDLQNRKVKLSTEAYTLGFDGKEVWVSPDKAAFGSGSPRFYHNLYFYFFTIPFILTDPGINYEDFGEVTVDSISYHKIGVSYGANVGDSPEDVYHLYLNPKTNALAFITYTVTYFSGESSDKFNSLKYSDWVQAGKIKLPSQLTSFQWNGETFGDKRGETKFENISLKKERPEQRIFEMPPNAEIDSLKVN